ncbi:MAG TPA: 1-(5-phosphoribosyl)-5-[(5-phosphoribosylamino)methylideneamino] imidazole-4-carboxamide isomerase [Candidatus Dormibacteraeota bacterium]|nr:1-(5-phosphoribosyl)-5-[(5-phosphoribosylamino)methylideneamino] imidazole-4-carboxamide isomerase [Candidatus Dormibacteraeota bacterium]
MLIIPAIDLLGGRAVRLEQGDFARVTDFGPDPVALARGFAAAGATWLHVVDLDGARLGHWCHLDVIAEIAATAGVPVQAGGGARDLEQIQAALGRGVARVIVGTAATGSRARTASLASRFGSRLVFSLDTRDRRVLIQGWRQDSAEDPVALAEKLRDLGARRFIHTDTARDGTLRGPNLSGLSALLPLGVPVLVAGGVATYADLQAIRDSGAEGAIVGRALLQGKIELGLALTIVGGTRDAGEGTSQSEGQGSRTRPAEK